MNQAGRHMARKAPRKTRGFAWGRLSGDEVVVYRLTRGDVHGRLFLEQRAFSLGCERSVIARVVNAARHRLRDTVDDVILRQLGVDPEPRATEGARA